MIKHILEIINKILDKFHPNQVITLVALLTLGATLLLVGKLI